MIGTQHDSKVLSKGRWYNNAKIGQPTKKKKQKNQPDTIYIL